MYSSSKPRPDPAGQYIVKDPLRLITTLSLMALIAGAIMVGIAWGYLDTWSNASSTQRRAMLENWTMLAVMALIAEFLLLLYYRANASGIVIDFQRRTLSFPGGNVSPNGVLDFLRPSFLLQAFHRYTVDVSDIRQINVRQVRRQGSSRRGVEPSYAIWFNGSFGAAQVEFSNRGKCEEICSAIRQVNGMGTPIIRG
jgi:hypothetical protein